jgi:hypothetical protein
MTSQWQPVDLLRELWTKLLAWPHLLKITAGVLLIIAVIQALFDRVAAGSLVAALFVTKRASAASSARASMDVGTLVLKKHLVLNAPCSCLLGTLLGEKS